MSAGSGVNGVGPVIIERFTRAPDALGRTKPSQVFGAGVSAWAAVHSARVSWSRIGTDDDELGLIRVRVYEYGEVERTLFSRGFTDRPDVDLLPECPLCGRLCRDPSAHVRFIEPLLADFPAR
ncbi:hypothetical protein [Streptomyces sp. NPDC055036]